MNTSAQILGVSMPMFTSVVSGLVLLILTLALFWLVNKRRGGKSMKTHKGLAWIILSGLVLHAAWGVFAVFVLKS
ncbi:MAG: hypothetical protein Q8S43_04105 [Actinomycetota bacterium]|nr:MAG: hypothetical protein FD171_293 [Actinomycetota bacterium]MDO8950332.1 hypothetical protein [Actinomycetota bacterium]MDP3630119.1 hypothetical protein [Actinomycetota bacterium]